MEDDNLLDEEILVQETQEVSPTAFSRNLINRLGFSSQQQHGTETVSLDNRNNSNNDEDIPSNSGVVSSREANLTIERELTGPLRQILKEKCRASAKCDYLRSCLARNTYPKGVTSSVPLKISNAPKDLQDKWTSILKDCTRQLTMTLVKFHQGQAAHQEQLAETLIHNASHTIIPEYITNVPDITSKIESSIEELMCETSLIDKKFRKRPHPTTKTKTTKKQKTIPPSSSSETPSTSTTPADHPTPTNPKNGVSSKGKDTTKHPWRPLKLKKTKK